MNTHKIQTPPRTPTSIICVFVVLIIFYIYTTTAMLIMLFSPRSSAALPFSILYAGDAMYKLVLFKESKQEAPLWWLAAIQRIHAENASVLHALAEYQLAHHQKDAGLVLLTRALELDPENLEYKAQVFQFLYNNNLTGLMAKELSLRGGGGLGNEWSVRWYTIGLDFIRQGLPRKALVFWRAAANNTPSSSHMWIEYASLLLNVGQPDKSQQALALCEKDPIAGEHCREADYFFRRHEPTPLGYYRKIILGTSQ